MNLLWKMSFGLLTAFFFWRSILNLCFAGGILRLTTMELVELAFGLFEDFG